MEKVNNTLSISNIKWDAKKYLCNSSLGEIICTLKNIYKRISKKSSNSVYEKTLNTNLSIAIDNILNKFKELLQYNTPYEKRVIKYNLLGELKNGTSIYPEEHSIELFRAKIGYLIKAMRQRVDFILNRDIPQPYLLKYTECVEPFNMMRKNLKGFKEDINIFEKEFQECVFKAHDKQNELKLYKTKSNTNYDNQDNTNTTQ